MNKLILGYDVDGNFYIKGYCKAKDLKKQFNDLKLDLKEEK